MAKRDSRGQRTGQRDRLFVGRLPGDPGGERVAGHAGEGVRTPALQGDLQRAGGGQYVQIEPLAGVVQIGRFWLFAVNPASKSRQSQAAIKADWTR